MKKELKREIKEDEFASWLSKVIIWGSEHRDELRIGIGVGVVLLAAFGALTYFQSHRAAEAEHAFQDALDAFEAPVASEIPENADRPAGQVFASAEDKYKTAATAFEGVTRRYGSSDIGTRAKYYAALARIELEQYAEAEKALRELVTPGPDKLLPDLARVALGGLYRRSGETDQAIEAYRSIASNPTTSMPGDYVLQNIASTLEDAERWAEARAIYRELVEQYPASVYAAPARARAEYLETAPGVQS